MQIESMVDETSDPNDVIKKFDATCDRNDLMKMVDIHATKDMVNDFLIGYEMKSSKTTLGYGDSSDID